MELRVWVALVSLCVAGGLMPGPAVMVVTTSAMRYGFGRAMLAAFGICAGNLLWIALAVSGASALARALPSAFLALKLAGVGYILVLAWRTARAGALDIARREPPPRGRLFGAGLGVQLANPNALVFFGGLLPAYLAPDQSLLVQCAVVMATVTTTELFGLSIYAGGAHWLARRFASPTFATWFNRGAAAVMAASALFAAWSTWTPPAR
jgi:threonine/homoserine/homoserine lactone efflux protein